MIREYTPVHVCADTRRGCLCVRVCTQLGMCVQKPEEDACVWECARTCACMYRSQRIPVWESMHISMYVCAEAWRGGPCERVCTHLCTCVQKLEENACVWEYAHNCAHVCRSQKTTATVLFYDSILFLQGPSLNLAFFLFSFPLSHQVCWLVNLSDHSVPLPPLPSLCAGITGLCESRCFCVAAGICT